MRAPLPALACAALLLLAAAPARPAPQEGGTKVPRLSDVAWIAGSWASEGGASVTEELWMEPAGGLMLGLNRSTRRDGQGHASFEYLRIEERADAVVYVASPGGGPPTEFALVSWTADEAVFANPEHDFPKRIVYRRLGADGLEARAVGDDDRGPAWTFRRVPLPGAPR